MGKKILIFGVLIFLAAGIHAETLTLEQARLLALASSRSLAKYELSLRSAILDEKNQLYSMLPNITAGYSAQTSYLKDWKFLNLVDAFSAGVNLSITQIIFQGGKSFVQKALNAISTQSVKLNGLNEYFNVLDSIDNAYYAVLESAAALEAEESSLQTAILNLSIAEIRHSSGMLNQGDYLKAMADRETRENSRNQARRSLSLNITRFNNLAGIVKTYDLEPVDFGRYDSILERLAAITDGEADALFDIFWKMVVSSNPSFAIAELNNQKAEKNLSMTKRDYAPTISATVFGTNFNYSVEKKGFDFLSSGGITLKGTIPLDFWNLTNRIEKSKISVESSMIDYKNTEISMAVELQNALLNAIGQAGSVLSSRRALDYTQRNFEFVTERYRLLQGSLSDMQDASSLLITNRNNLNRASYGFLQNLSKLRSLCALDDEEKLLRILSSGTDQ